MNENFAALPPPDIGREYKGTELQILANIRQDFASTLKQLFPRTSDGGLSEFDAVNRKYEAVCKAVERQADHEYRQALAAHDLVRLYQLRTFVGNLFFNAFKDWSRDDLLALTMIQQSVPFMGRYPGIPQTLNFEKSCLS